MTDMIENFTAWYQGLPQAAQIGIPVAGAAGVFLIARHKGGLQGSQVFGPGSSQGGGGGGTATGPPISTTPPGPPPPGAPPAAQPSSGPLGIIHPLLHPPGSISTPTSGGAMQPPVSGSGPERSPLPAVRPVAKPIVNPYVYPVSFGKPLPGASHPIYTGQGNAYIVNGQDIAHSGLPPAINPTVQIGPTPAAQRAHVQQYDVKSPVAKAPASTARQRQRAGFTYHPYVPPTPKRIVVQHPPSAIQRGGRLVF